MISLCWISPGPALCSSPTWLPLANWLTQCKVTSEPTRSGLQVPTLFHWFVASKSSLTTPKVLSNQNGIHSRKLWDQESIRPTQRILDLTAPHHTTDAQKRWVSPGDQRAEVLPWKRNQWEFLFSQNLGRVIKCNQQYWYNETVLVAMLLKLATFSAGKL